jgi:hypothetical protein
MTGHAAGRVIAVEREILVVIEGRRRPLFLAVALAAGSADLFVQRIDWRLVARLALLKRRFLQQGMLELSMLPVAPHP